MWAFLTISLRRSSVGEGTGTRTTRPSELGFRPRSLLRIAFSMSGQSCASQGWMRISVASGVERFATWFSGVGVP